MRKTSRIRLLTLLAGAAVAGGCVSPEMTDLEQYVAEILARPGGQIAPLPPIKPYEPYIYQSDERNLRDPFVSIFEQQPPDIEDEAIDDDPQGFIAEILAHEGEELEKFPLDSLRMVGVMESPESLWGIIRDPTGTVHRVQVGNYMGSNYGKIMSIDEAQIEMRELVQDTNGRWEERAASLALTDQ